MTIFRYGHHDISRRFLQNKQRKCFSVTARADSVDKDLVAGTTKAAGQSGSRVDVAAWKFEQFAARVAMKVVMMSPAGGLITRRGAGHIDRDQPAFFEQQMDVAVDGRNAEPIDLLLGQP